MVDLFAVFEQFPDESPKSMKQVADLIASARRAGREELARFLENWMEEIEYQIGKEWEVREAYK